MWSPMRSSPCGRSAIAKPTLDSVLKTKRNYPSVEDVLLAIWDQQGKSKSRRDFMGQPSALLSAC
jgi:hypothetical protein